MEAKSLIRNKPWLKYKSNFSKRLLDSTRGNAFIVYNLLQGTYELHTIEAYKLSGDSYNCSLDREFLTQFLVWDYKATNFANNLDDILSEKALYEHQRELKESRNSKVLNSEIKIIERTLGTRV